MEVREQRVRFVVAASRREKPFQALCEEFEISRPTGYLWWKRYREQGVAGIAERSRRPYRQAQQIDPQLEQEVEQLRQRYPDWGARKLQILLARQGVEMTRSTIHRTLLRRGLVQGRAGGRRDWQRFQREQPNQLWQMDFKGPKNWPRAVGPLSVLDDYSRYLIVLNGGRDMCGETVREQLESAFIQCGVPEGMLMDHGSPWWGRQSPCGMTQLSLWLMRQGIRLHYSGVGHPQTQGKVERFHGSLQRAAVLRQAPTEQLQNWLDAYRWEHNHLRPHQALQMKTPASLWRPSTRRYEAHPPRWVYDEGAWVRKLDCEGGLQIAGQKWHISAALRGEKVQIVPLEQRLMIYYCTTLVRELDPASERSTIVQRWVPLSATEGGKDGGTPALENA
jgi:transposase InsO family protein